MTSWVLDASVAAKWFLPPTREPLAREAWDLLRDHAEGRAEFLVPDLFWPEFGNILWKAVRQQRISRQSAAEAIASLRRVGIPTYPAEPLLEEAFTLAASLGRTVYDCIYVVLAVVSNRPLVTADERLVNALAGRTPVRWLGSL